MSDDEEDTFLVDNIFKLGAMPIYVEEMNAGKSIKLPQKKAMEKKESSDSFGEPKKASINDMIEQGKREITRLRDIDKKFLHPEMKELSEVLMNAIIEMEELKEEENEDFDKDSKKDKESDFGSDISVKQKKGAADTSKVKVESAATNQRQLLRDKFAQNKRNQVDPYYQEQLEEVERIKKALTNKDIHLDMKIIRRAVLMTMFNV